MSAMISTAMASQETVRVYFSPMIAPNITRAIAPTARMISDSAGAMSGNGNTGIGPTHKGGRNCSLSAPGGGEGRGEVGVAPARNDRAAQLTLPSLRDGPLPLPPQAGGEGQV